MKERHDRRRGTQKLDGLTTASGIELFHHLLLDSTSATIYGSSSKALVSPSWCFTCCAFTCK